MPACFQLYAKDKPGEGPVILQRIDEAMCAHFEVPCDPVKYLNGWFDSIGFRLAIGKSFAEIKTEFEKYVEEDKDKGDAGFSEFYRDSIQILDWLAERYAPNAFHSSEKG